ncbi:MAG: hypothetical protein M0P71_12960 [Melioribacteraceae bacterium]|jgi:hypothetical protein|nr:hypothetical protein [Melioribacteraceae bacterium]
MLNNIFKIKTELVVKQRSSYTNLSDFLSYMEDKYIGSIKSDPNLLKEKIKFDIDCFCKKMISIGNISPMFAEDLKYVLEKHLIIR